MSRKSLTSPPIHTPPSLSLAEGIPVLESMYSEGVELLEVKGTKERITTWYTSTCEELVKVFGSGSSHLSTFRGQAHLVVAGFGGPDPRREHYNALERLKNRLAALSAIIEAAKSKLQREQSHPPRPVLQPTAETERSEEDAKTIFVVHGHSEAIKQKVARFLTHLHLRPIILHEETNAGRTIIEKFEDYASSAAFAVILATADDIGGVATDPTNLKPRARQNVIFEMGFFAGRLRRSNVCVLHERNVELPSDLAGILSLPIDPHDSWRMTLAKEMRDAGVPFDPALVLSAP